MKPFTYVIIAMGGVIILLVLILIIVNKLMYGMFKNRFDGDVRFKFLTINDYPGLVKEDVSIKSVYKVNLNGGIFYYPKKEYKGVIIFYHGLLSGWYNYLYVIEYFAKHDYKVVAFDMYGCMSSEGKSNVGMAHGDKDNKRIIDFVISNKAFKKLPIYTLGHSWGGHLAMTSVIHDDKHIKKACALTPYNSNVDCAYSITPLAIILAPFIYLLNLIKFGIESTYKVTDAIKYSKAKMLILTSGKDRIVKPEYSYKKFKKAKENNNVDNVILKHYENANHFLYMCDEGAKHFDEEISFPRATPIDFKKLNYKLLYKLNEDVLREILYFFNN